MNPHEPDIDPDLLEIVHDIEAGAPSKLFALEPHKLFRAAGRGELPLRSSRTGLATIDRQLLDVHRHELAYLLRWVFAQEFPRRANARGIGCPHLLADRSSWTRRVARLLREDAADASEAERKLVDAYRGGADLDLARVVAGSLALVDSPVALCYLAWLYAASDRPLSAQRTAHSLASRAVPPAVRLHALECVGYAHASLRKPEAALHSFREAARVGTEGEVGVEAVAGPLFNVLVLALLVEDGDLALHASSELGALAVPDGLAAATGRRMKAYDQGLDLRAAHARALARLADRLSPPASELLHALV